jgi:hypothetical protein
VLASNDGEASAFALSAGSTLRALGSSWRSVAHVENGWTLDNQERGEPIATCRRAEPLAASWGADFARDTV